MKNGLVVKDNALINASYNLELTEQRLVMLAIINAREFVCLYKRICVLIQENLCAY
jgi:hypothetical protein